MKRKLIRYAGYDRTEERSPEWRDAMSRRPPIPVDRVATLRDEGMSFGAIAKLLSEDVWPPYTQDGVRTSYNNSRRR